MKPQTSGVKFPKNLLQTPTQIWEKIVPTLKESASRDPPMEGWMNLFFPPNKIDPSDYHQRWPKISSSLEGNRQDHLDTWMGKSKDGGEQRRLFRKWKQSYIYRLYIYIYIYHILSDMGGMEHQPKIQLVCCNIWFI